jgi:exodeoxyribonuclease-5
MSNQLIKTFPFKPTSGQEAAIRELNEFIQYQGINSVFILKGYAGTGKTTLISSVINWLPNVGLNSVLVAPTGRAAKVLSSYSKKPASTIHKQIYYQGNKDGRIHFTLQKNKQANTIFVVDEASMIGDSGGLGGSFAARDKTLLDDLFDYVFSGVNCKIILLGDVAQLPPVGGTDSPALQQDYLSSRYPVRVWARELTEVTRQSEDSGILFNATLLREILLQNESFTPNFILDDFVDIKRLVGYEIEEHLSSSYSNVGIENTVVICRSNKQANNFNKYIKFNVLWQEEELNAGDLLMVVRNNYYWVDDEKIGFIANGDMVEIMRVVNYEEKFGFRFANVSLKLSDYKEGIEFEVKILLDTLTAETPALSREEGNRLYEEVQNSYIEIRDKRKRQKAIKENPYFNALQVKFGYAITCHKSQGGQWDNVFVDQGYLTEEMIDREYIRWLYTAITRAKSNLYLTNFHPRFFGEESF